MQRVNVTPYDHHASVSVTDLSASLLLVPPVEHLTTSAPAGRPRSVLKQGCLGPASSSQLNQGFLLSRV